MKTGLTQSEIKLLNEIVSLEDDLNNICFNRKLTANEKGVIGSLVKKGMIYNAFDELEMYGHGYDQHNYFPTATGVSVIQIQKKINQL